MGITLGAGIQKSRGKGRLHGIYGAEAMISFDGAEKTTYEYGNAFILDTTAAANQGTANVYDPNVLSGESYKNSRNTEVKTASSFSFGVDAFIGVEYFFAPKMSFSAEYNWGITISSSGEGETTTETTSQPNLAANNSTWVVTSTTTKTGGNSDFNIGNGNINSSSTGNIVFHFYF